MADNPDAGEIYANALRAIALAELSLTNLMHAASELSAAGQAARALQLYRAWINKNSAHDMLHVALFNRAVLEAGAGDDAAAIQSLAVAVARNPEFLPASVNLGGAWERSGHPGKAIEIWNAALARPVAPVPQQISYVTTLLKQIARVYGDQLMPDMAEQAVVQCLGISPQHKDALEQYVAFRLAQCKWPALERLESLDQEAIVKSMHPLSAAVYTDDPLFQLGVAERYVRETCAKVPAPGPHDRRAARVGYPGRRIKIGYVSSDLRDHAVGYLMAELFERHDRAAVEIFAYYCGPKSQSDLTKRTQAAVEHWREIRDLSNEAAAAMVARDGVDILVDVNGHTRDAKLGLFALRPAPIQVNWLGFPGSMGSAFHHYVVADDWIVPPGSEKYFSERVMRLPCYQPNDRRRAVDPAPTRAAAGLPDDAVVFCCFNGTHKISRFMFERWMEILRAVPEGVLWLLDAQPAVQQRLRNAAAALGVDGARLLFSPRLKNSAHLARYPLADVFLDTSPYGAHTTASDALWMGVPVVTFSGRGFASRVCGSLVRSAGLPELVSETPRGFVETAIALARDPAWRRSLRERLVRNRSTCVLFDTDLLTKRLEELYKTMCVEYEGGALPRPDLTNLDAYLDIGGGLPHEVQETAAVAAYEEIYRDALASRHLNRPLPADRRIWTHEAIESAERAFARRIAGDETFAPAACIAPPVKRIA
jgi:predicted O-linked N-acetylglucosamine transferase (SPINDLY family)